MFTTKDMQKPVKLHCPHHPIILAKARHLLIKILKWNPDTYLGTQIVWNFLEDEPARSAGRQTLAARSTSVCEDVDMTFTQGCCKSLYPVFQ